MRQNSADKPRKKRDRIGTTIYGLYLLFLILSVVLLVKIARIQLFYQPDQQLRHILDPYSPAMRTEPMRGNIYDCEGRLLAISCPIYQIAMDCTVLSQEFKQDKKHGDSLETDWLRKAKLLSEGLTRYFPEKTAGEYYERICSARRNGRKYIEFGKPVDRNTYLQIIKLPLFEEGANKGGLVIKRKSKREYPYGGLARHTIGFVRDAESAVGNKKIGLDGKFDYILHGSEGTESKRRTDYGSVRNSDSLFIAPVDGQDIRTTINIDYQYIADQALHEQIDTQAALQKACFVLMEVKTGAIRAMVNLSRSNYGNGPFSERENIAIGYKMEPGSVFKTVTLMSVLSDGYVKSLDETMPTNHGVVKGTKNKQDVHILDYEKSHHTNRISIIDGYKMSSNYVFATLAVSNYLDDPQHFYDNISSYKLADKFEFDLEGLATPTVRPYKDNKYWTPTELGSVGFGYATMETPLHILTYYNAIANRGRMMKPYLVDAICENGEVVREMGPSVLSASICSPAVTDTMKRALCAVTEEGTAQRLKSAKCKVAGKTGTSFGTSAGEDGKVSYGADGGSLYRGTFVGFFPAEDPQYSVICTVISKPTHKSFQGGRIPAIVVKNVIDKIYNIDPYFRPELKAENK